MAFSKKKFDGFFAPYKNVCKKKNLVKSVAENWATKKWFFIAESDSTLQGE